MKLFDMISMQYNEFADAVRSHLSKTLSSTTNDRFGNNTVFGQLINVVESAIQNVLLYIEDSLTEQNKYTVQRKKSIYALAAQSGYEPSLGKASGCNLKLSFKPTAHINANVIIPDKTQIACTQNGLTYNFIFPQEAIYMAIDKDNSSKYVYAVEGRFETQNFVSSGGQLYTINVSFNGDADIEYTTVYVNNEKWERTDSIYDMESMGKQYMIRTSPIKGFELVFGNGQHGKPLEDQDVIKVEYLVHSGEVGNISPNDECSFMFKDALATIDGDEVDGDEIFVLTLKDHGVNSGTFSESANQVKNMIGYNSRSFCLSDPNNYKVYINRFSFCGYNRTWCEEGSLTVNSMIMKNYASQIDNGRDYFNLNEDDFILNDEQKDAIISSITSSGQQLAGSVYNIFDPTLSKYAMYMYITMKDPNVSTLFVETQIRDIVGKFFCNVNSDIFIPKSDIILSIKNEIEEIDSIDIYFLSEKNEAAIKNGYYKEKTKVFDPNLQRYVIKEEVVYLYPNEDPGLGLDEHGNIYIDNDDEFPVLMGGWSYISNKSDMTPQEVSISNPLIITFK